MNAETILGYTILAGLLSIVCGFMYRQKYFNASPGNQKCKKLHLQFK